MLSHPQPRENRADTAETREGVQQWIETNKGLNHWRCPVYSSPRSSGPYLLGNCALRDARVPLSSAPRGVRSVNDPLGSGCGRMGLPWCKRGASRTFMYLVLKGYCPLSTAVPLPVVRHWRENALAANPRLFAGLVAVQRPGDVVVAASSQRPSAGDRSASHDVTLTAGHHQIGLRNPLWGPLGRDWPLARARPLAASRGSLPLAYAGARSTSARNAKARSPRRPFAGKQAGFPLHLPVHAARRVRIDSAAAKSTASIRERIVTARGAQSADRTCCSL